MNELEFQVRSIKQAVRRGDPKGLILKLLDTLEGYVAGDESAQQYVQRIGLYAPEPCPIHGREYTGMCGLCVAANR